MLKDIETGQSRRMGYVTFEDGRALTEAIEEMHEAVCCCCAWLGKLSGIVCFVLTANTIPANQATSKVVHVL